ncbi:MAG TPA: MinD/ParA family protein [Syntrophorhabdaceae bacterium]|jgi:flagellar biosynthesis protein FlhG
MEKKRKRTITITSGKGGVGKSSIVSNMAYLLGLMDKSTYILDADLSLGNIDIMFGMYPKFNIKDLIEGRKNIGDIICEGPCGIRVIPATSGVVELSELTANEKNILFSSFQELPDHDFLLVDTSAGISSNVIDFNAISEEIFVIVTPDPASLTDSYAVIKVLNKKTGRKDFNIILNMVRSEQEGLDIFKNLLSVTDRFLDVYLNFSGYLPTDANINLAVRKQKLWVQHYPNTEATKALQKICERLVS